MANSILLDRHGSDWPLGYINVPIVGTPISIMSLVDPTGKNDPSKPTPGTSGADEYTVRCQQIMFQAYKPGAGQVGAAANSGNIYIVRKGVQGAGNRLDQGVIVAILSGGQTFFYSSAPLNRNVFSPYRYFIDADQPNEGAWVTLIIQ